MDFKNNSGVTVRAIEYRHDANDQKVAEYVDTTAPFNMANASAKWFIHDGANVVLDFADTDTSAGPGPALSKRYFQGPGVDQLLVQENVTQGTLASNRVWWVLPDHLGSTRDLVTGGGIGLTVGTVVAHFQFDSFGQILDGRENVTRYQFTGREHDSHTDLNYHRARWYDPASGKWLSEDPISFTAGDPNITRMVGNNVPNATDPSGLWETEDVPATEFGSHYDLLQEQRRWTYSRHRLKFTVIPDSSDVSEKQIMDDAFTRLRNFSHFNNTLASVALVGEKRQTALFDLHGLNGFMSDQINDNKVAVRLKSFPDRYELIAQTYGWHQLVGIRKWRLKSEGYDSDICGYVFWLETEADERAQWANTMTEWPGVDWLTGAREAMREIWKGYLERTADKIINHFGTGSRGGVSIFGPVRSAIIRPNHFKRDAWKDWQ